MKISYIILVQIIFASVFSSFAYAQLASQSFPGPDVQNNISAVARAQLAETAFSDPGILPDNPLYIFKRLGESVRLFLTFDNEKKAALHQDFAKTRLAEAKKMFEENKTSQARDAVKNFDQELNISEDLYNKIGDNVSSIKNRDDFLAESGLVLNLVLDKVPEQAKPEVEEAINSSIEKRAFVNVTLNKINQEEKNRMVDQVIKKEADSEQRTIEKVTTTDRINNPELKKEKTRDCTDCDSSKTIKPAPEKHIETPSVAIPSAVPSINAASDNNLHAKIGTSN